VQNASAAFYGEFRQLLTDLASQAGISNSEQLAAQWAILIAGAIVNEQIQRHSGAMRNAREAAEILLSHQLESL
jgi:hypothetical protein